MAASSTAIANLALSRMGQDLIDDIAGSDTLSEKCNLIYTQCLEELLVDGPEKGWKFARKRYNQIDREKFTITAFAAASTNTTVTATHTLQAGDLVEITGTTNYDGVHEVVSVSTTVSFVINTAYVANDTTGTAYWTSEDLGYRYALPSCLAITRVAVGGLEITDWNQEGQYLLTNLESSEIDVEYIANITTTTLFPPWFTQCLVLKMAIKLHYNLTQDLNAIRALEIDLDMAMSKAKAIDERQKYAKEKSTSWVDAGHTTDEIE